MVQVYTEPLCVRHLSPRLSSPWCFRSVGYVLCVVAAFATAYNTESLWLKTNVYTEQARVAFRHEAYVVFEGARPGEERVWTTSAELNAHLKSSYCAARVRASEVDTNHDGLPDALDVRVSASVPTSIHGVKAAVALDYSLAARKEVEVAALVYAEASSALAGAGVTFDGDVRLRQREPLRDNGRAAVDLSPPLQQLAPLVGRGPEALNTTARLHLPTVLSPYYARNVTTVLDAAYTSWEAGDAAPAGAPFELRLMLRVPPHETVTYRPGAAEAIKFAWMQFLAAYVIFWFLFSRLERAVFHYRVLPTRTVTDAVPGGGKAKAF